MSGSHGEYLGTSEGVVDTVHTPTENALMYITMYGGIDGAHHKDWVLDQVARILNGAPVVVYAAKWEDGYTEYRPVVGESEQYHEWVAACKDGENGPDTYSYSVGIAP